MKNEGRITYFVHNSFFEKKLQKTISNAERPENIQFFSMLEIKNRPKVRQKLCTIACGFSMSSLIGSWLCFSCRLEETTQSGHGTE